MSSFVDELREALQKQSPQGTQNVAPLIRPVASSEGWANLLAELTPAATRVTRAITPAFGAPGRPRDSLPDSLKTLLRDFENCGATLSENIRESDLRAEWRRLARLTHPDRNVGLDGTRFTRLQSAYLALVRGLRNERPNNNQAAA